MPTDRLPLTVCIIARNEEDNLPHCLESVAGVAAQIVVVDTGSTDRTIDIARSAGAEVHCVEWQEDFAAARNAALECARQPWILVLDADERLATPEAIAIALDLAPDDVGGYLVSLVSTAPAGEGATATYINSAVRLVRNDRRFRYSRRIHEQIIDSILASGYRIEPSAIVIEHSGYALGHNALRAKLERNLRLLNRALAEEPNSAFYHFYRGRTLQALGNTDDAWCEFETALRTCPPAGTLYPQILAQMALIAAQHKRYTEAIQLAERSLELVPGYPLSLFIIAESHRLSGNVTAALEAYRRLDAAQRTPDPRALIVGTSMIPPQLIAERIAQLEQIARHLPAPSLQQPSTRRSPQQPLLSLAMIVRNEEHRLPQCLESVRGVVDEIIVVDTGSTDGTVEVARSYGARVYHFAWCDDFAAARNEALRHCTGQWILYLDADERLTPESAAQLRSLLEQQPSNVGALLCTIISPHRQANGATDIHRGAYPRVFRNYGYPRIAFRGRVHEQITPAILECGGAIVPSTVAIYHTGYDIDREDLEAKVRRNYRLLIQHVQEEPLNGYAWFQLAQTLARMQLIGEAEQAFHFALRIGLSTPLAASATCMLAQLAGIQGRYTEALQWAERSLELAPDQALALNYKAHALYALGRFEEAHAAFEQLLSRLGRQQVPTVAFDIEIDRKEIEQRLAEIACHRHNHRVSAPTPAEDCS